MESTSWGHYRPVTSVERVGVGSTSWGQPSEAHTGGVVGGVSLLSSLTNMQIILKLIKFHKETHISVTPYSQQDDSRL